MFPYSFTLVYKLTNTNISPTKYYSIIVYSLLLLFYVLVITFNFIEFVVLLQCFRVLLGNY